MKNTILKWNLSGIWKEINDSQFNKKSSKTFFIPVSVWTLNFISMSDNEFCILFRKTVYNKSTTFSIICSKIIVSSLVSVSNYKSHNYYVYYQESKWSN